MVIIDQEAIMEFKIEVFHVCNCGELKSSWEKKQLLMGSIKTHTLFLI